MKLKLPLKLRLKYLNRNKDHFEGKVIFHEKEFAIDIHATTNTGTIKVPFQVIGVTDEDILVRVSGPSGVYAEEYMQFNKQSKKVKIESYCIFDEVSNNQEKFDTLEIFVR